MADYESPKERFERLAELRVAKVENELRKLANLSNGYTYDYNAGRVAEIRTRVREAVDATFGRFDDGLARKERREGRGSTAAGDVAVVDGRGNGHGQHQTSPAQAGPSPDPDLPESFVTTGLDFGTDWRANASGAEMLEALRGRPAVPTRVDRDLLQFASIMSSKSDLDELDRKAVRKGFWDAVFSKK
jgi:hypothetical protein